MPPSTHAEQRSTDLQSSILSARRLQRLNGVVLAIAAAVVLSLAGEVAPTRAETYGAIAFSDQTGYYAWSVDQGSAKGADGRALSSCTQRSVGCKVVISFSNSCAALAVGSNNRFATGQANNSSEAQGMAMNACRVATGGGDCNIRASYCVNPPTLNARPGLWQLTSEANAKHGGGPAASTTSNRCIKPADVVANHWVSLLDTAAADGTCSRIDFNTSSNTIHWKFACNGQVQLTTEGSVRFDSPEHYTGTLSRKEPTTGPSSADVVSLDGKWVGPCVAHSANPRKTHADPVRKTMVWSGSALAAYGR